MELPFSTSVLIPRARRQKCRVCFCGEDLNGDELTVMYHPDYGGTFALPGSGLAVSIEMRDDNSGPHTPDEIAAIYKKLRASYPNAKIIPSTLTDIAVAIAPFRAQLPVLTQEIGDTWIHGVPSDPVKVSRYREIARFRQELIEEGKLRTGDAVDLALLRRLTLAVEHTWGVDTKKWIDYDHYKPSDLAQVLTLPGYRTMTSSWAEKREDIDEGVASLPPTIALAGRGALAEPASHAASGCRPETSGDGFCHRDTAFYG